MDEFEYIVPVVLIIFFVGIWLLIMKIISVLSGWTKLVEKYNYEQTFTGKYYRFQSALINKVQFRGALNMGMDIMGLYMIPVIFFRLFHKPVYIPWSEIEAETAQRFFIQVYRLRFRSCPNVTLTVYKKTFERMQEFHQLINHPRP